MKTLLIFIFTWSNIYISYAQDRVYNLQQCIDSAIKNNIDVRQSQLASQAASINYRQAKSNLLPDLNGQVSHGINRGRSIDPFTNSYVNQKISYANYGLGSGLLLFNGFSFRNTIRQAAYAYDASRLELQQEKDEITLAVILAYLEVLSREDLLEVSRQQVIVSQTQLDRLDKLNQQGAINPPQVHEIRGQLKESELNVLDNNNALELAKLNLLQLMNVPARRNVRFERTAFQELPVPPSEDAAEIYNSALEHLSLVKASDYRKKSAEAAIKATKGRYFPTLSFNGNINTNYSSIATRDLLVGTMDVPTSSYVMVNGSQSPVIIKKSNYETQKISYGSQLNNNIFSNIGLTLRIPILNGFQVRNQVKLAEINYKASQLIEESVKLQLRQQVEQAHLLLLNAYNRYVLLNEQVESFREAFRAAEVRFNAGVGTSIDYILAKNNYDRAKISQVNGRYDFLLRKQVIQYFTGLKQ